MNDRIGKLLAQAHIEFAPDSKAVTARFAKLLIEDVLDQVKERAYYTGDRDWSDDVDRPWIQLEYGYGKLADAQKGIFK
jgi:hypothetical protein